MRNVIVNTGTTEEYFAQVRETAKQLDRGSSGDILLNSKGGHTVAFAFDRLVSSQLDPFVLLQKIPLTDTCIHLHLTTDVLQKHSCRNSTGMV